MRSLLVGMLLTTLLLVGWSDGHQMSTQWERVGSADFDGDGKDDVILGEKTSAPHIYGPRLLVRSAVGKPLLALVDRSLFYLVTIAPGPLPILVVGAPNGNWLGVQALMYHPETHNMQRLQWDQQEDVRGREVHVDPATGEITMWTESGRATYRFKDGALRQTR